MKKLIVCASILATALVGGGVAYASIPDSSGQINGCYNNYSGDVRIIDSSASCRPDETSINWTQTAPVTSYYEVTATTGQQSGYVYINCTNSSDTAISGGLLSGNGVSILDSYPEGNSWTVHYGSGSSEEGWALCAHVS